MMLYFLYVTVTRRAFDIFNCNPLPGDAYDGFLYTSAVGIGAGVQFVAESAGGIIESGSVDFKLTAITDGAESSSIDIRTVTAGTVVDSLSVTGVSTTVHPTTSSTSSSSGALQVLGGIGVAKAIYTAGQFVAKVADTSSGLSEVMHMSHTSSNNVLDGFGLGINFHVQDQGDIEEAGSLEFSYTNATLKNSQFDVKVKTEGNSIASSLTVFGDTGIAVLPSTASTSSTTGGNNAPDQTASIRSLLYCTRFGPYLQEIQKHRRTR
jgi:hypothetical protein